jgi:hypothetical protein
MKKVLEEELAARSNDATTVGICVGESSGAKASFWLQVLGNTEKTDSNERSEVARKASGKLRDGNALSIRIAYTPYVNCMRFM